MIMQNIRIYPKSNMPIRKEGIADVENSEGNKIMKINANRSIA